MHYIGLYKFLMNSPKYLTLYPLVTLTIKVTSGFFPTTHEEIELPK